MTTSGVSGNLRRQRGDRFAAYLVQVGFGLAVLTSFMLSVQLVPRPVPPLVELLIVALGLAGAAFVLTARRTVRNARMWLVQGAAEGGWPITARRRRAHRRTMLICGYSGVALIVGSILMVILTPDGAPLSRIGTISFLDGYALVAAAVGIERAWLLPPLDPDRPAKREEKFAELVRLHRFIAESRDQARSHREEATRYRLLRDAERDASAILFELRREVDRSRRSGTLWDLALVLLGATLGVMGNIFTPDIVRIAKDLLS